MERLQGVSWLRAAGLGALFACLGLSFALATSESRGLGGLAMRGISTTCTRPPAVFVTDADLGIVVIGTQFTRQLIVRFGFKPHRFFFGTQKPNGGISLSESGTLSGTKDALGQESFDVRVEDQIYGESVVAVTKTFQLTAIDSLWEPNAGLYFVNAPTLPVAVANEPYSFTIHANGGMPPYIFQFGGEEDLLALPAGLSLNIEKGLIMGKPVAPSPEGKPAAFTLVVTDSVGTTVAETFFLVVLPGTISSEFVGTAGAFKLLFGREGTMDSLKLTLVLNKTELARNGIRQAGDLAGVDFGMDFGGVTLPPPLVSSSGQTSGAAGLSQFDKNGAIRFPNLLGGVVRAKGENLEYEIKLNPRTGILNARFKGIDMIKQLGANFKTFGAPRSADDTPGPIIPVNVRIGAAATAQSGATSVAAGTSAAAAVSFDKTDVVKFLYVRRGAVGKGTARANDKLAPAGLFLVTKVRGVERQVDVNRDRLFLSVSGFLRQVGGKRIEFGTADEVHLLIGNVCLGCFPASSLKNVQGRLEFVNEDRSAGLYNLVIDNKKGTFYFDTHGVDPRALFGADILVAGEPLVMPVTLTIAAPGVTTPVFDGQSSVTLFRRGNSLRNK